MIFAIVHRKGGVGKTTVTFALADYLARKKKKVLLLDLDAQASLTHATGCEGSKLNMLDVMQGKTTMKEAAADVSPFVSIVPGTPLLASADVMFTDTGREFILQRALAKEKESWDYVLLDTPPALGILTINAMTAADSLIIPAIADYFSITALDDLIGTIGKIREFTNPKLTVSGLILSRYKGRTTIHKELADVLEERAAAMGTKVLKTRIRDSITASEASACQQSVIGYAPKSPLAKDFLSAFKELMEGAN